MKLNVIFILGLIIPFVVNGQMSENEMYYQNLGIDIDLNNAGPAQLVQTPDDANGLMDFDPIDDQSYFQSLMKKFDYTKEVNFPLPSASDLIEYAQIYSQQGLDGLVDIEPFSEIKRLNLEAPFECDTIVHKYFYDLARLIQPDDYVSLSNEIENILNNYFLENKVVDTQGEDWQIENPFFYQADAVLPPEDENVGYIIEYLDYLQEAQFNLPYDDIDSFIPVDGPFPIDDPIPANAVFIKKPKHNKLNAGFDPSAYRRVFSASDCQNLENQGKDSEATFSYTRYSEITVNYKLCGEDSVYADYYESSKNKYYVMPDWTVFKIHDCITYNSNCAPMYIQMIAADILYQRKIFARAGYKIPGHRSVNVRGYNNGIYGSSMLGTINLYAPTAHLKPLRELVWHEYFHTIQTQYGSEWQYFFNGEITGSQPGLQFHSGWWSQLESLADWSIGAISLADNPYPSYISVMKRMLLNVSDSRNHLFNAVYHPLEYGYIAERYSAKPNKISACLGCDTIKKYLTVLQVNDTWKNSWYAMSILLNGLENNSNPFNKLTIARFITDFHLDLLFSRMKNKWAVHSGNFRFLNRSATAGKEGETFFPPLIEWPPAIEKIPNKLTERHFGTCDGDTQMVKRSHAKKVGNKYIQGFNCNIKMAPTGAIYLDLPLDQANLPDRIMLRGIGVQLLNSDARFPPKELDNFKIKPGEFIDGNLRVFSLTAKLTPKDTLEYENTYPKHLYRNRAVYSSYVIEVKSRTPDINHLFLAVDYPIFTPEWVKTFTHAPDARPFMARVVVVAYWDN